MLTSPCDRILRGGFSPPPRPEAVNTMDALDFTEEEIQEQLAILGYRNIPKHRLHEFKQDLDDLIRHGEWKSLTSPKQTDATSPHPASSQPSPPPYTKEKVSQSYFQGSDKGFFLHSTKTDHESQVHNTSQIRRCEQQQGNRDSYARYSVAPKLQLPSGAPSRRQVEQHPEDLLHPSLTDSYTSPPHSQRRRLIKRKVLRKHEGQSLVCDESFFSEDSGHVSNMYKMYNAQWEEGSEDDKDCLSSSFWTDEEKQEEEEEEIERVVSEEDSKAEAKRAEVTSEKENGSIDEEEEEIKRVVEEEEGKPVEEAEEASEEEKPDLKNQENFTGESSEDGSDEEMEGEEEGADDEEGGSDDEEEEEETEREVIEDKSKLVPEAEDPFKETSEEERLEVKNQENFSRESLEDGSEEEEGETEDDEIERVVTKEESKPVEISGDGSDEEEEEEEEEGEEIERVVNKDEAVESSEEEKPDMKNQDNYSEESSEDESDEMEEEEEGADDEEDGSDEEEKDEGEETEQEFNEEESKLVAKLEDFLQEASEEERVELKNQENFTTESREDGSDEEEEEEIERVVNEDDSKPLAETEEEQPEVKNQENFTRENSKCGSDDEEEEEEEEGNCTSSCSSPAQSLMTSGYGTYRPEEQEGGDDRDDHTITEFDQDSRGDVSEMRDEEEEDDRSLSSFGFEMESTRERGDVQTRPESEDQNQPGADGAAWRSPGGRPEEEDVPDSQDKDGTNERPEGRGHVAGLEDGFTSDEKHLENGKNPEEGTGSEKPDEEEREAEEEDPDESSSNKDIKFIDSKVDFSWMAYDEMEWEGNLRQKKASGLEEGLAELHVSSSTQQDFETENEDVPSHSSEEDRISLSAFESYISCMTESESDFDLRPKPKSFISPAVNQQNLKKTDPVTKYFQYKQFWEAFKVPGERDRRALRWEIRERLAQEPPPAKPRRVLVPNTYTVPTEKKRAALRWEIRSDLAHGLIPHTLSHGC